jgi:MFS family permease
MNIREPDERYGWYIVFVLILAYTISYVDRQILTLLVEPIKASLGISDVQVSLLHGLAFAIFYTSLGLPLGRLADRRRRVTIITVGVFVWSLMTALCGLARGFWQLFAARVGVGVGEAALSPAAYSMLADSFGPKNLPRALSAYTGAIYAGAGLALVAGGTLIGLMPALDIPFIGRLEPWQGVFLAVAAPGLIVGLLTGTLREPARRGKGAAEADFPSLSAMFAYLGARRRAYGLFVLGYSAASLMWNGAIAWIATYFIRAFGLTPAEIGVKLGLVLLVAGTGSIMLGGVLASRWRAAGIKDAGLRVGILSTALALPFVLAAPFAGTAELALILYAGFIFGGAMPYGAAVSMLQEMTPNRMRAQVSALYLLGINMGGLGLGPTVVALVNEQVLAGGADVGKALALTAAVAAPVSLWLLLKARRPCMALLGEE